MLDALQKNDPDDTSNKQYNWNNIYEVSVWANRKNTAGTQYIRSVFFKNWLPVPGLTTGDANTKGTRSLSGNSETAKEFNQPIVGSKIKLTSGASGYVGTLAYTPLQVPDESVYAIRVIAIEEGRSGTHINKFNTEDLDITASMVAANKTVTIKQTDLNVIEGPNYAYVNYLYDKTSGVYPTLTGSGMFTSNV